MTLTPFRASSSEAFTTCSNDLGVSRLGFEQLTVRMPDERSYRLRHLRGRLSFVPLKQMYNTLGENNF